MAPSSNYFDSSCCFWVWSFLPTRYSHGQSWARRTNPQGLEPRFNDLHKWSWLQFPLFQLLIFCTFCFSDHCEGCVVDPINRKGRIQQILGNTCCSFISGNLNFKELSAEMEGGQTLKTETAEPHGGVIKVCQAQFFLMIFNLDLWPDTRVNSLIPFIM